jgi:hypothetical protein
MILQGQTGGVMRGLDPRIHPFTKGLDCRVTALRAGPAMTAVVTAQQCNMRATAAQASWNSSINQPVTINPANSAGEHHHP